MMLKAPLPAAAALAFALAAVSAEAAPAPKPTPAVAPVRVMPVRVMIVGDYHMGNPGQDIHNARVDDVLQPRAQAQIQAATEGLSHFKPTKVMVEWPADAAAERYAKYRAGTLEPCRNEVVQLGFRLAKGAGLDQVLGIDADGDFPFEPVAAWANAHGQGAQLDAVGAEVDSFVKTLEQKQAVSVSTALRFLNDPVRLRSDNAFYRTTLRFGAGADQPGADLLTAWYRRNFLICANIIQQSQPGDRVVVFYGSGHAFLLRQCIQETPGFELVEPNAWLPKR